jgi:hypothetical protein
MKFQTLGIFLSTFICSIVLAQPAPQHCHLEGRYKNGGSIWVDISHDGKFTSNLRYGDSHAYHPVHAITPLRPEGFSAYKVQAKIHAKYSKGNCQFTMHYHLDCFANGDQFDLTGGGPKKFGIWKVQGVYRCMSEGHFEGPGGTFYRQ